ncbi:unnamed protein product [Microthlaspi erraticum]|uniref:SKP1-like protein n=1 Tax=Microthlaspi erraticum TaxID=1685480 RepID=A0A6D2HZJ1_9BRAS|nr:unnamed protein product [Microthlaspi erraticum]
MSKRMIVLKSSDGELFEIEKAVALQLQRIAHMVEDEGADNVIPLENVTSQVLTKVIEYCKNHVHVDSSSEWDAKFMDVDLSMMFELVKAADESMMFELVMAAHYLNIKPLVDLTCQAIAYHVVAACETVDEIRAKFGIVNDFTPEEEEELRKESKWAFE